ncbi:hypothetical protein BFP70_19000 [Thioclava sp. SK-1]|nr:hypothetical protein BFP70_19000 [Thioclava sp. SK-1]
MTAYRIGDPNGDFPIWDAGGARLASGRWHQAGAEVIYASQNYSTAMLEKLVHYQGALPPNQHFLQITFPTGLSYEVANTDLIDNWAGPTSDTARQFGRTWYEAARSAILQVPSVVARMEYNLVINTRHPDFARIQIGLETPVWWDKRLFA